MNTNRGFTYNIIIELAPFFIFWCSQSEARHSTKKKTNESIFRKRIYGVKHPRHDIRQEKMIIHINVISAALHG